MINRIIVTGRLTAEPEFQHTQSGVEVCRFSLACDRRFKNAAGERETDFINVVVWRGTAKFVADYCHKGYLIGIEGSLQQRRWTNDAGENRSSYQVNADAVELLGRPNNDKAPAPTDEEAPPARGSDSGDSEADLPF